MSESCESGSARDQLARSDHIGSVGACGADRLGWGARVHAHLRPTWARMRVGSGVVTTQNSKIWNVTKIH
jgi:hypothetical protein